MKTTIELLEATEERDMEHRRYRGIHPTAHADLELNSHYNGSGIKAFGGHKRWPHIGLSISLPADVPHSRTETLMRDLHQVLRNYGYNVE